MFEELLRAIDEDIDNLAHWHPLADWLIEHDDPRGELINIDLALEGGTGNRDQLLESRAVLLNKSAPKLLGETFARVVADGYAKVVWRRGFIDEVSYTGDSSLAHRKAVGWLVKLMTTAHEPFTLLRKLDLSYTDITDLMPLARFTHLETLRIDGTKPNKVSVDELRVARPSLVITGRRAS